MNNTNLAGLGRQTETRLCRETVKVFQEERSLKEVVF